MNARIIAILDVLINAAAIYLNSVVKVDFIQTLIKSSAKQIILFTIFLSILLLSTWVSGLGLVFFYLVSIQYSYIQATLAVLGLNLLGLFILLIVFMCMKNRAVALRRSSTEVMLSYLIKVINEVLNKHA